LRLDAMPHSMQKCARSSQRAKHDGQIDESLRSSSVTAAPQ
jgi:hypothetical protein